MSKGFRAVLVAVLLVGLVLFLSLTGASQATAETTSTQVYTKWMKTTLIYEYGTRPIPGSMAVYNSWAVPQNIEIIGWELEGKMAADFPLAVTSHTEVYAELSTSQTVRIDDKIIAQVNGNNSMFTNQPAMMQNLIVSQMLPVGYGFYVALGQSVYLHHNLAVYVLAPGKFANSHAYVIIYYRKS